VIRATPELTSPTPAQNRGGSLKCPHELATPP
jgi:hypothetical protein